MRHSIINLIAATLMVAIFSPSLQNPVYAQAQQAERGQAQRAEAQARRAQNDTTRAARNQAERAEATLQEAAGEMEEQADSALEQASGRMRRSEENRGAQRAERGQRRSPEQLMAQLESARMNEMERHESRIARIEEIRTHAEADANEHALTRLDALVEKELALHDEKIMRFNEMELRFQERLQKRGEKGVAEETEDASESH
jgi:hypothetical protein